MSGYLRVSARGRMVKPTSSSELDALVSVLSRFPAGASIDDILTSFDGGLSERVVQRRLVMLIKNGAVIAEGQARARRYRVTSPEINPEIVLRMKPFTFSAEAKVIQEKLKRPVNERGQRVGYKRSFLEEYRPNNSYYLTEANREYLREIGKVPDGKRPAGTYAKQILHRLLIDLSWNSSRLEGNTYSLLETERLIDFGEEADEKSFLEARMILNHKEAIEFLVESIDQIGFDRRTILSLHALLSRDLLGDKALEGQLRNLAVGIGQSVYTPPSVPQLIEECFDEILTKAASIKEPFEQAFFIMVHLPYLQPFIDVNKRVSRLSVNIPLIRENLSPLSFIKVPEGAYKEAILAVYELNEVALLRDVFIWAYEQSCMRYSATQQAVGMPDRLRLRYSKLINETIVNVVRGCLNKKEAIAFIKRHAEELIPLSDRFSYVEIVERDLTSLHKGHLVQYRLLDSEFEKWKKNW